MSLPPAQRPLAIFDFDGTITFADSLLPFFRETCGFVRFWLGLIALLPVALAVRAGLVSNGRGKELALLWYWRGRSVADLEFHREAFYRGRLQSLMNPVALERLTWHRAQGHQLVLLSASPELYLAEWGKRNGFDHVIATRLEITDGHLTGRLAGLNCHGPEKVTRLRAVFGETLPADTYSYGDSRHDRFILAVANHPGFRAFHTRPLWRYRLRAIGRFLRAVL